MTLILRVPFERERSTLRMRRRGVSEDLCEVRAPQPQCTPRLRRSHVYFFFFVKAGPKSGLT